MRTITSDLIKDKRILIRLDLDVPLDKGTITDTTRLESVSPTLELLKDAKQIVIIGHLERPGGKIVEEYRLRPIAQTLSGIIGQEIQYIPTLDDTLIQQSLAKNQKWNVLENLRFHPGEEANSPEFSVQLAQYGDIFVFEAFAVSHRNAASTVGITHHLPSYAGLRVEREVEVLSSVIQKPDHPFLAIIGGAKIETKVPVIKNLSQIADTVFVGGKLIKEINEKNITFDPNVAVGTDTVSGYDIDENSRRQVAELIKTAALVVWNGPVGMFEDPASSAGTQMIAEELARSSARKIIGGGETSEAVKKFGISDKIDFISVGGGAMLEFLSGKPLPVLQALEALHI